MPKPGHIMLTMYWNMGERGTKEYEGALMIKKDEMLRIKMQETTTELVEREHKSRQQIRSQRDLRVAR